MRARGVLRRLVSLSGMTVALSASPALATRTVIDSGTSVSTSGYCSPSSAGNAALCSPYSLTAVPPLVINGTTYNSFYVNSNGTVSLGSIETFLSAENSEGATGQTSLSAFGVPIFSPFFAEGAGVPSNAFDTDSGFDGNLAADTTLTSSGFIISWFSCVSPLACGSQTVALVTNTQYSDDPVNPLLQSNIIAASTLPPGTGTPEENFNSGREAIIAGLAFYTAELTTLSGGFQIEYSYSGLPQGATGTYGFVLPNANLQQTGVLTDQVFQFNTAGELVNSVPEPSTWVTMLLGFGILGFALRRARPMLKPA